MGSDIVAGPSKESTHQIRRALYIEMSAVALVAANFQVYPGFNFVFVCAVKRLQPSASAARGWLPLLSFVKDTIYVWILNFCQKSSFVKCVLSSCQDCTKVAVRQHKLYFI